MLPVGHLVVPIRFEFAMHLLVLKFSTRYTAEYNFLSDNYFLMISTQYSMSLISLNNFTSENINIKCSGNSKGQKEAMHNRDNKFYLGKPNLGRKLNNFSLGDIILQQGLQNQQFCLQICANNPSQDTSQTCSNCNKSMLVKPTKISEIQHWSTFL